MRDDEFERLWDEHARGLLGFLIHRTGDRALAEDLLSETFERALRGRGRFDRRRGSERGWLYAIALNLLRDHARRRDAERRALDATRPAEAGAAPDALGAVDDRDVVARALATLDERDRDVVALRYVADLSVEEIARASGERRAAVESRLYRALRKLRERMTSPETHV